MGCSMRPAGEGVDEVAGPTLDAGEQVVPRAERVPVEAVAAVRLQAVAARELNLMLDKTQQTSDWAQRPLTLAQLEYAALDAEVLFALAGI